MEKEELMALLFEYKITQSELAGLLDLDQSTITRWMNGTRRISKSREIAIRSVLNKEK